MDSEADWETYRDASADYYSDLQTKIQAISDEMAQINEALPQITMKASVTIRWYGTSNGYYSEGVDFDKIK